MHVTHNIDVPLQIWRINAQIYFNTKILRNSRISRSKEFQVHPPPPPLYCLCFAGDVTAVEREGQEEEGWRQGTDTTKEDDHQITHHDNQDSDQNVLSKDIES